MDFYQKILLIAFLLLSIQKYSFSPYKKYAYQKIRSFSIQKKFKRLKYYKFFLATTTGVKIPFKKNTKNIFKTLNLLHLFTPSGIHLTSFFYLIFPLLFGIKRISPISSFFITIGIFILPWSLTGFYSIKRICLLGLTSFLIKSIFRLKLDTQKTFLLVFFIDYIFGTYSQGNISFIYSFLFLGIIYSRKYVEVPLVYLLFSGQILIAYFMEQSLTLLGPFLGFIITSLFSLFFPILLSFHFLHYFIDFNYVEYIIEKLYIILEFSNNLAISSGSFQVSILLLISIFFISKSSLKKHIPFLILFHSNISS